jgi:hypothetical protein
MEKPRGRWKDAVLREAIDLVQIWNWKAAARNREGWRKEMGEAMAQKWAKCQRRRRRRTCPD